MRWAAKRGREEERGAERDAAGGRERETQRGRQREAEGSRQREADRGRQREAERGRQRGVGVRYQHSYEPGEKASGQKVSPMPAPADKPP